MNELRTKVLNEVRRCIEVANRAYPRHNLTMPTVRFDLRGTVAGTANSREWEININETLLRENPDEMISNTTPHEVAHLIDAVVFPETRSVSVTVTRSGRFRRTKRSIHGPTWKMIMRMLGADPSRTHNMDTTNARVKVRRYHEYFCAACNKNIVVGPKHHAQIQKGGSRILHKPCRTLIVWPHYRGLANHTQELLAARQKRYG